MTIDDAEMNYPFWRLPRRSWRRAGWGWWRPRSGQSTRGWGGGGGERSPPPPIGRPLIYQYPPPSAGASVSVSEIYRQFEPSSTFAFSGIWTLSTLSFCPLRDLNPRPRIHKLFPPPGFEPSSTQAFSSSGIWTLVYTSFCLLRDFHPLATCS